MSNSSSTVILTPGFPIYTSLTCLCDFIILGELHGEAGATIFRLTSTLITVSIVSSWCNSRKIKRLLLFFAHWLSGLVHQMTQFILGLMVTLCWCQSSMALFIRGMKFIELVSLNMVAVTNLAICVNLALIVSSTHTMSRVRSVSSPKLLLYFLLGSIIAASAVAPFWEVITLSQTLFWCYNFNRVMSDWILGAMIFVEITAGIVMLVMVTLLLIFRMPELKQCWQMHLRIKFYFILTVVAIVVNLAVGIGGLLFIAWKDDPMFLSVSWAMRHTHIALDTLVLYSALGVSTSESAPSSEATSSGETASVNVNVTKRPGVLRKDRAPSWDNIGADV